MRCTGNTTNVLVAPAADGFGGTKSLEGTCNNQGILRNVGEEGARHVQPT